MRKALILAILVLTAFSCRNDNGLHTDSEANTGIISTVKYGEGDCMPVQDETQREYTNYNGLLYFILKSDLDILNGRDLDELKSRSIVEIVVNGNLKRELPEGTYVIMPKDMYQYDDSNTITVISNEVLKKNFRFWKCITQ